MTDLVDLSAGVPVRGRRAPLPPPFDPEIAAYLAAYPRVRAGAADQIETWRKEMVEYSTPESALTMNGLFDVSERSAVGLSPDDPAVPLLVCRAVRTGEPVPVLYYVHGGGMVGGTNRTGVDAYLAYAAELNAAVIAVEYRLAPENPYPAAVHDCLAGLLGVSDLAEELNLDSDRVLVAGASAGSGLAAGVALLARDRGIASIAGLLLECPMLDDRNNTPSAVALEGLDHWDRADNELGWGALLGGTRGTPDVPIYAAPARATDLRGLPPVFIDAGSAEIFRDEAVSFASQIWFDGGVAELHVWPGGCHGFDLGAPDAQISKEARQTRLNWLHRILG